MWYENRNLKKAVKKIIDELHRQNNQRGILFFVVFIVLMTATIPILSQLSYNEKILFGEIIIVIVIGSAFIYGWAKNYLKQKTQKKLTDFSRARN